MDRLIQELPSFLSIWNIIFLLKAMGVTFLLSLIGCLVGFSLGTLLAIFRKTKSALLIPLRILIVIYTEIFRRIPFLVSLLLIFYIFQIGKITDSLFIIAIVTVCLIATAYISEIVRSGLESVSQTQWDAAKAMNFSYYETLKEVIFPQAWKVIFPPAFSFFILFAKKKLGFFLAVVTPLGGGPLSFIYQRYSISFSNWSNGANLCWKSIKQ